MKRRPFEESPPHREHLGHTVAWTRVVLGLILALPAPLVGCSSRSSDGPPPAKRTTVPEKTVKPSTSDDVALPVGYPLVEDRDVWETVRAMGHKLGHQNVRVRRVTDGGRDEVRIESTSHAAFLRFGQPVAINTALTSRETRDGRLIDFEATQTLGPSPTRTRGRVEGDRLYLEITGQGQKRTVELPWSERDGGLQTVEFSLLARPMRPGETRTLRGLMPVFHQTATVRITARGYEEVQLLDGVKRLLRVESSFLLSDGQTIDGTLWIDERGETLKTLVEGALRQETYRCGRDEALDEQGLGTLDIGLLSMVALERRIPWPHASRRIRYRASLADGDPAAAFVSGFSQQVKSLGPHSAELTVLAVRPDEPKALPADANDAPTPDDLAPNSRIQSDDQQVRSMARAAVEGKRGDWEKAVALERYVHENIHDKNLSQALASAAEVARSRAGDCTEHAVLLAAMARAEGLPARVAIGLVYVEQPQEPRHAFGYHMWTEIFVEDRWIPMDATLGLGGIGGAHLKLAHANLKDADAMNPFLPVIKVLGQLKLEVLDCE
ncbi:MAG: transglutaminase domain-containing protein [Pirellulaceae bacterium]|nr:transglutaminase domain-containing protein [Pirellulaceae bacterium]